MSGNSPAGDETITLEEALTLFLERKTTTVKPRTLIFYQERCKFPRAGMGVKIINELSSDDVNDYVRHRQKMGLSNKTITEELNILKQAIKILWQDDRIKESPVRSWPQLKLIVKDHERVTFYSQEEIEKLKWWFSNHPFGKVFLFCLYIGVRRSEVREVKMRDIRLDEGFVTIRSIKTEGDGDPVRYIPIHPELKKVLTTLTGKADDYAHHACHFLLIIPRCAPQVYLLIFCLH